MGNQPPKTEVNQKLLDFSVDSLRVHCNNQVGAKAIFPAEHGGNIYTRADLLERRDKHLNDLDPENKYAGLPHDEKLEKILDDLRQKFTSEESEEGSNQNGATALEADRAEIKRQNSAAARSQYFDTYSIREIYSSGLKMFMAEELGGKGSQLDFQGNILKAKSTYMDADIAESLRDPFQSFSPKPWEPSD